MKVLKYFLSIVLIFSLVFSCTKDNFNDIDFLSTVQAPTNVAAVFNITQDNTGLVTITPTSEGAINYDITFGDGAQPINIKQGQTIDHIYGEGNFSVKIVANGITGLKTEITQDLLVSFKAPTNLIVVIANDVAKSKTVNVTATADYATAYKVYFGEVADEIPVMANIGETVSYTYQNAGTYTIRVVAMSAAIATTEYTEDFAVTAILQPLTSAPLQPARNASDVISIYSSKYTDVAGTNYFPDWGQGSQGSSWAEFDLNGDKMLQYIKLSYQGIALADGVSVDVSGMEFLHMDVWTADVARIETSLISLSNGEKPVWSTLTADAWTSINIPISAFTSQGLTVADIFQLKFVGDGWAVGTVFIDNIYFYKAASGVSSSKLEDFEGAAPTFTDFGNIGATAVIANPDKSGVNTTNNVAQFTKTANAEVWGGTVFVPSNAIDLVNYSKINLKSWSPKIGAVVKVKLENADASIVFEVDATTTKLNAWEDLSFDFSTAPIANYVKFVIFFDFGAVGDGAVYYFDEIQLVEEGSIAPLIFQTFEDVAPTFTNFGNGTSEVTTNPDQSGINTSAKVAQFTKASGAEVWAGSFFEVGSALDFNNYSSISVKTWSPKNGAVVKVKLENQDSSIVYEVDMNTTKSNTWEELVFDFSGAPAGNFVRVVIFFDFGNTGDGSVYYYDNFTLTN